MARISLDRTKPKTVRFRPDELELVEHAAAAARERVIPWLRQVALKAARLSIAQREADTMDAGARQALEHNAAARRARAERFRRANP